MLTRGFVDIDGVRTRFFTAGTGYPIVFIHEGGFDYRGAYSALDWQMNLESFARRFRVFAPDKLGLGQTDNPKVDQDYTISAMITHIWGFIEAMELDQPPVLVGHSRGALVAARLAADHPREIRALVVVNSSTLAADDPTVPADFYERPYASPTDIGTEQTLSTLLRSNLFAESKATEQYRNGKLAELREGFPQRPMTPKAMERMWRLTKEYFLPDIRRVKYETLDAIREGALSMPVLVVWGMNDNSAPFRIGADLFQLIGQNSPRAELHVFNRTGHRPHVEHAQDFEGVVTTFIDSVVDGGTAPL